MARRPAATPKAALVEALLDHARTFPGLDRVSATVERMDDTSADATLAATAWSASLHRQRIIVPLAITRSAAGWETAAIRALHPLREAQDMRHAIAAGHGLEARAGTSLAPGAVLVDQIAARILAERGHDPARVLVAHRRANEDNGLSNLIAARSPYARGIHAHVQLLPGDAAPLLAVRIVLSEDPSASFVHDGIQVDADIPETLLAAAVGRPLGQLLATRIPALDARIVTDTIRTVRGVGLMLEPDTVTIAEARIHTPLFEDPSRPRAPR